MSNKKTTLIDENEIDMTNIESVKSYLLEKGKQSGELSHEEIADKLQNFDLDSDAMDEFCLLYTSPSPRDRG